MAASRKAPVTRRPILRFDLDSVSIDDRPNAYKKPQLVIKPQLELAPRKPYTGSRPRAPIWRHFLMVHVRDKADELVKLDLDTFKPLSPNNNSSNSHSVICLLSRCILLFQYPGGRREDLSSLTLTLQNASDVDTVVRELNTLGVEVEHEQPPESQSLLPHAGLYAPETQPPTSLYGSYTPSLTPNPNSQGRLSIYQENRTYGSLLQRPPSQPNGPSPHLPAGPRPWSPAFVPSRPATALGVPGVLGEGIYKVSKVGSRASSRLGMRRNTQSIEQHDPKPYTVSKHFDKTLSRADIALTARGRHLRRGLSFTPDAEPTLSSTMPSGLRVPETEGWSMSRQMEQPRQPTNNMSSSLREMPFDTGRQSGLRRLRTIGGGSGSSLSPDFSSQEQHSLLSSVPERGGHGFSQPLPGSGPVGDTFHFSSSPTLLGHSGRGDLGLEDLLLVSQIQHQGLCEASKIWADFMDMVGEDLAPVETMEDFLGVLSKFEDEFGRHWDDVVVATTQRMAEVYGGSRNF